MKKIHDQMVIYFASFITFATYQSPQALYNTLQNEFSVSVSSLSLLVTVIFLPLAVAPLGYGFLLESCPPKRVLSVSFLFLAAFQLAISLAPSFPFMLTFRILQGLLIPAVLTSLMTFIGASSSSARIQSSMAMYIGSTILGGFLGRLLSGLISSLFGWRYALFALFAGLVLSFALTLRLSDTAVAAFKRPQLSRIPAILKMPGYLRKYLIVFCAFFVFSSLLNFLPFRLASISLASSDARVGAMYTGFTVGIFISLAVNRFINFFGGEMQAVLFGISIFLLSLLIFLVENSLVVFAAMFVLCGGMFLIHTILPGYLNKMSSGNISLVNGLYLSFYYAGGSIGSFFPGMVYHHFGWNWFIALLMLVLGIAFVLAFQSLPRRKRA